MNYKKIYLQLIEQAKERKLQKLDRSDQNYIYTEIHHIVPRALNETDENDNLVVLTGREHYVAHRLLANICKAEYGSNSNEYRKMLAATMRMASDGHQRSIKGIICQKITSRKYESLRAEFGRLQSIHLSGNGNPAANRKWMYNQQTDEYVFCKQDECEKYLKLGYIFRGRNKGLKMTIAQRQRISKTHADVSGNKNPMYGHSVTEFMNDDKIKKWHENMSKGHSGKRNGAYGKKWLFNVKTKQQLFIPSDQALSLMEHDKNWIFKISDQSLNKIRVRLHSIETQMKNIKTRYKDVDFSEFDFESYVKMKKGKAKGEYLAKYVELHLKK